MASGYTANYGLCQWQRSDKFLREEFNGDNEKIDAALKAAEDKAASDAQTAQNTADRALAGLEAADYNIYNLLLQNEYEGKYTGYKKALLYDGFLDESRVASKSAAIQIKDRAARLSKTGQGNITTAKTSDTCFLGDDPCSTGTKTATGGGVLTGFTFSFYPSDNYGCSTQMTVTYNGEAVARQKVTFDPGETGTKTVTLETPVELIKGDTFSIKLDSNNSSRSVSIYLGSGGTMAGTIRITAMGAASGNLTATAAELTGTGEKALVFVRYTGGGVTPTLNGAELVKTGHRKSVEVNGQSCNEDAYEGTWSGGSLAASFTLNCGNYLECVFFDYGIVVL
ncbi:hypothetical protein [Intestinimonas timonensis]|uniref:hypothetical protein n=1 Tax=Intestinimonas timonensis TaxID=1689270 RepID=UPI001031E5B4|nr:hypothetical protein [Intestinimonas timonensis]